MKEHVQFPGVRKWTGTDLVELQGEVLKVLNGFFAEFAPMILSGCQVEGASIKPGIVVLPETIDGETSYRIATFEGADNIRSFPVYLTLKKSTITRDYANATVQPIVYYYQAVITDSESLNALAIYQTGGNRFRQTLQDASHRFVTDAEKEFWGNKPDSYLPFSPFYGIVSNVKLFEANCGDASGSVVFDEYRHTFVKRVRPRPGVVGMVTYYPQWNSMEEYVEVHDGYTVSRPDKLFLYENRLYYFDGVELVKIGASGGEDYTELVNIPCINGVRLVGDVSLHELGIKGRPLPFIEIIETAQIQHISLSGPGEIVFVKSENTFALRINPGSLNPSYVNNWPGREEYTQAVETEQGVHMRPFADKTYIAGGVEYIWNGNGLISPGPKELYLTQTQYDALESYDDNTKYYIIEQ